MYTYTHFFSRSILLQI